MLRTVFFWVSFWLILIFSIVFFVPLYFLKLFKTQKEVKQFVYKLSKSWAKTVIRFNGVSYTAYGRENIPAPHSKLVVVSNHQGSFDIAIYLADLPFSIGYIAKYELKKLPIISVWMKELDCIFIKRTKLRETSQRINEHIRKKDKNPIFIFPEGTRSKSSQIGAFKPGTLKLLFNERADIFPVTVNGSYKVMEINNRVRSAHVEVFYHPVIHCADYRLDDFETFIKDLHRIIAEPLVSK